MPKLFLWFVTICLSAFSAWAGPEKSQTIDEAEERAFKQAVMQVTPSLVRIETVGGLDQIGSFSVGNGPTTGIVVSADGYVISSSFNFVSKPNSIIVSTSDGKRLAAKVIANDTSRMLTLLKVEADGLLPAQPAAKQNLRVGQWAIAVGRALDATNANVSVGIVSAVNRIWGKAIQTDAKISPVNYGGALVDVEGRVLGVLVPMSPQDNSPIAGVEWYDSGIGFAIPLEDVFAVLDRLKEGKDIRAGLAGFNMAATDLFGGDTKIDRIRYDSPMYRAGFKDGDVIVEVDGQKVTRPAQVKHVLGSKVEGDKVALAVKRGDETLRAGLTLVGELPPFEAGFLGVLPERRGLKADSIESIADGRNPKADGEAGSVGVGVRWVYPDSPAAKIGVLARDRIVKFRDRPITSVSQLIDQVSRVRPTEKASLVIRRDGKEQTLEATLTGYPNDIPKDVPSALMVAPKTNENSKTVEKPDGKVVVEADANKPADSPEQPRTGRFTEQVPDSKNSWWALVPGSYNRTFEYGLVVWLHPPGDTHEAMLFDSWKIACELHGIILLAPKAADLAAGWQANEAEFVRETVVSFQKKYAIDANRIVLHGFANSGPFATHLAFKHRDLFRGLILAGIPITERPPENMPEYRLQFHLLCGSKDKFHPFVERNANGLRGLKYPTTFTSMPDLEQRYPNADGVEAMVRWVDSLDRL